MKLSKGVRLGLGAAAVLISILLSWALEGYFGPAALLWLIPGAGFFLWLNPELMGGK